MRKTITLVAAAFVLLLVSSTAFAQTQEPVEFRALYHMTLTVNLLDGSGGWVPDAEPVHGVLNGEGTTPVQIFVTPPATTFRGKMGQDVGLVIKYVFNDSDSITVGDTHATYEYSPGKASMYTYHMVGQIVAGTGRFENATGSVTESGPYILWNDPEHPNILRGKYNAAVAATIFVER